MEESRKSKTGYYQRMHRCAPRLNDFFGCVMQENKKSKCLEIAKLASQCFNSKVGEEPTEPLRYHSQRDLENVKKLKENGRIFNHILKRKNAK